ncbi:MAG: ModE family transcriptional regulator [Firmicutes bacterium HGW-Firmicutes-16]|nr:MAG: ModE family transcriptional regulator [Firmicutes bacterium HGW-Firmicutes-16]
MEENLSFRLAVRLFKAEKAFGPGIATLLRTVEQTGSLQKATEAMGMAYSKAWKMIKEIENVWGFPLTYRDIGGKNGGGSSLTPEGRFLLERYELFTAIVSQNCCELFSKYYSEDFYEELKIVSAGNREVE